MILESEQLIYFINQRYNTFDLITDLFRHHKDVRIILCEAAYTHQSVKLTGFFMTVYQSKFTDTERKIFIRTRLCFINKHSTRTVHWFDCKVFIIDHGCIHIFFIVIPVSRCLPQMSA